MLEVLAIFAMVSGSAVIADPNRMAQIDRLFTCPENLPSDNARIEAIAKFDSEMKLAVRKLTLDQLGEARMYLLKKHRCYVSLANLAQNGIR